MDLSGMDGERNVVECEDVAEATRDSINRYRGDECCGCSRFV